MRPRRGPGPGAKPPENALSGAVGLPIAPFFADFPGVVRLLSGIVANRTKSRRIAKRPGILRGFSVSVQLRDSRRVRAEHPDSRLHYLGESSRLWLGIKNCRFTSPAKSSCRPEHFAPKVPRQGSPGPTAQRAPPWVDSAPHRMLHAEGVRQAASIGTKKKQGTRWLRPASGWNRNACKCTACQ